VSAVEGALLGLVGGLGAALAVARVPVMRRPTLEDRVAPYLRDAASQDRLRRAAGRTSAGVDGLLTSARTAAIDHLDRWLGGSASVRRRLDRLGSGTTLEQFRARQLVWGGSGVAAGLAVALLLAAHGQVHPVGLLIVIAACGVSGLLACDRRLSAEVAGREQRILVEFPTIAELLSLSVAAGEGAVGALERVTSRSHGERAGELGRALADARSGVPLARALERVADRTSLPELRRFVDGVVVAVERGTPLAEVLRAQAVDVREAGRRRLMEAGARREIAMMLPVVFLLLPLTVVFALFPGFYGLSFTTP
jgi:tight adherence protein C